MVQVRQLSMINIMDHKTLTYYISACQQKNRRYKMSNKNNREHLLKHKQLLTLTSDVSGILKLISRGSRQNSFKNTSQKMNKTQSRNSTIRPMANHMTQDDLDKLFNHPRNKQNLDCSWNEENYQDFTKSYDKYLSGLPTPAIKKSLSFSKKDPQFKDLTTTFKKQYLVGKVIGEGAYASVRIAIFKPTQNKVAIKVYQKDKIRQPQKKKSVLRQIKILQSLNHPNIVKIQDVIETNNHLNISMEYLSGISLNQHIKSQQGQCCSESQCKKIIRPLVQALKYLHQRHIAHRDIKLQNIILGENLEPKLIDFGFSTCIQPKKHIKLFCGTPSYMSPQIVQKKQCRGENSDVWALGVLLFVCLSGIFPFRGSTDQELYRKINHAEFPRKQFKYFSYQAGDLIKKMLEIDPSKRITASQMLYHPWLKVKNPSGLKQIHLNKNSNTSISLRKKVGSISIKSRDKSKDQRRMLQTYKQNHMKCELQLLRKSPGQINNLMNTSKQLCKTLRRERQKNITRILNPKKNLNKTQNRVLDLLKGELKKRQENRSASKGRKIY